MKKLHEGFVRHLLQLLNYNYDANERCLAQDTGKQSLN
jgi:hypothetical protein